MHDEVTIGARLRILRRWRGLSLEELGGLANLSKGFLSKVENGKLALDRRSYISALAAALQVSETDLVGGPHLGKDRLQSDPHTVIPSIRLALQTNTLAEPAVERARPLPELVAEMARIEPYHQACDYVEVGRALPALLDELHLHVWWRSDEAAHRISLETLIEACTAATFTCKDLGYPDLAHLAATRAQEAAAILDDPVRTGEADFLRVHTMPRAGSWDRTLNAAQRAAGILEPHVTEARGWQVLGMLSLSASLAAAVEHDTGRARDWLDQAAGLAAHVPDTPDENWMSFSATNVGVWDVAVNVECGEHGGAVKERAARVDQVKLAEKRGRHAAFLADVGRGLARDKATKAEAIHWLYRAEQAAPQWIRNHKPVRDSIAVLLSQARAEAGGRELRGMAARMGVPH
ncbi:helix-turn-helix transcriptional regulator [Actinomadura barringtoniae]|uniref:Helix-turn-helix transcriptional regulator n=1 Tax=Actinomadura barringtoniae TaxID=1427535 RepID=A0A939T678_9ACTN|nr:helix-turn-helix transcriptional regulator [Actinomadura barringtoniae]MBO2450489.1 helix-turn-helix transcriptional regulator [Actinomadura barringtoniae]